MLLGLSTKKYIYTDFWSIQTLRSWIISVLTRWKIVFLFLETMLFQEQTKIIGEVANCCQNPNRWVLMRD